jgi:hypothetical protein
MSSTWLCVRIKIENSNLDCVDCDNPLLYDRSVIRETPCCWTHDGTSLCGIRLNRILSCFFWPYPHHRTNGETRLLYIYLHHSSETWAYVCKKVLLPQQTRLRHPSIKPALMDNRKSQSGAVSGDRERARQRKEVMGFFRTKMCRAMPNSWRPLFLFLATTTTNNLETRKTCDTDSLSMAGVWRRRGGLEEQLRHGWMNSKIPTSDVVY